MFNKNNKMNEKVDYHYGDVVWVKGPTKYFPAVIASRESFNRGRNVVIIPLTKNLDRRKIKGHCLIKAVGTSVATPEQIRVVDKEDLGGLICQATEKEKIHLGMSIAYIIGDMRSLIGTYSTPVSFSIIGTPGYYKGESKSGSSEYRYGDIFWVNFPESSNSETNLILKSRPCVIISQDDFNKGGRVVVIPLTTQVSKRKTYKGHSLMKAEKVSVVLPEQIRVVNKTDISTFICHATDKELFHLNVGISYIFESIRDSIGFIRESTYKEIVYEK